MVNIHHPDCPIEKLYNHDCPSHSRIIKKRLYNPDIEWDNGRWNIALLVQGHHSITIPIEFCPFCGEELPELHCDCENINQGLREQNIYFKTDGRLP